ncbi:MAG TPA: hypothetical protein VGQ75_01890 [Thermoanaerobaculia bacterium]|nr:hypothetical protein [Thermoanaerobaculia bacterium]
MSGRKIRALTLAAALLGARYSLLAQCSGVNHVIWPTVNPVWDFCYVRPSQSSTANGSGIEITNVKFKGVLILARAHLPILNVKYAPNPSGCGGADLCYRDWLYSEGAFECAPTLSPGYCTGTTTPATTVCQHPGEDLGTFSGVAVEDRGTSLKLTSQCEAGWYRYIPVWEFFPDGRLEARFVASSIDSSCVAYTHHHQAYFRLDFDVAASAGNFLDQILTDGSAVRIETERNFIDTSPSRSKWRIGSPGSPYVVEVSRNPEDGGAGDPFEVPNDFPVADGWILAYDASELADSSGLSVCRAGLDAFLNSQSVDGADIVLWVRAAALHQGEGGPSATDCSVVGPTIRVLPVSPPAAPTNFNTVASCRIVDTRKATGPYGGPALQGNATRTFGLTGQCGIPATAKSLAVNVTVTQPSSGGHITAYPAGASVPLASTVNFSAGQTRANNTVLPLGAGGAISVTSVIPSGTVHLILDVTGWFE